MPLTKNALELCRRVSDELDIIGSHTPEDGIDCLAYSDAETKAIEVVCREARALGAEVMSDQAGNLIAVVPGKNPNLKAMTGGSHVDAVPNGGQYDGRAGVLLALGSLQMMKDEGVELDHDNAVIIFRAEESPRFGKALLGSAFATGRALAEDFNRGSFGQDGQNLKEAMRAQGLPVEELAAKVDSGTPLLPVGHIGGFIEMHIEQSDVIKSSGKDVGIVTAIRGNVRADINLKGIPGHTGGAAQFSWAGQNLVDTRADAARGMFKVGYLFEEKCREIALSGRDIVFSIPVVNTPGASLTKICDDCYARFEVRSTDPSVLSEIELFIERTVAQVAKDMNLTVDQSSKALSEAPVERLSEDMVSALENAAKQNQISAMKLFSGAGHDAKNMHHFDKLAVAMIFAPHSGPSHVPYEDMVLNKDDDPYGKGSPFEHALITIYDAKISAVMPEKEHAYRDVSFIQALQNNGAIRYEA